MSRDAGDPIQRSDVAIGRQAIEEHDRSAPGGRELLDLGSEQPDVLMNPTAVLSSARFGYDVQLRCGRTAADSESFAGVAPSLYAGDRRSLRVLTQVFPAEYGVLGWHRRSHDQERCPAVARLVDAARRTFLHAERRSGDFPMRGSRAVFAGGEDFIGPLPDPPVLGNYTNRGMPVGSRFLTSEISQRSDGCALA